jgi:DNA-directed RNA polymerase subunit RPC12/RpoP
MTENELLLYPLGGPLDQPRCAECGSQMLLVRVEARSGQTDYSTFRCPACGHSETFIAEDAEPP